MIVMMMISMIKHNCDRDHRDYRHHQSINQSVIIIIVHHHNYHNHDHYYHHDHRYHTNITINVYTIHAGKKDEYYIT